MSSPSTWLMTVNNGTKSFVGKTTIEDEKLIYRAFCKFITRGNASKLLSELWSEIDPLDGEFEETLLDQFMSQADKRVKETETSNVTIGGCSVDITVEYVCSNKNFKGCNLHFKLYQRLGSIRKQLAVYETTLNLSALQTNQPVENVEIDSLLKTPAVQVKARKARRRNSRITLEDAV